MLAHGTGMIGLPLRLLAREIYDKMVQQKGEKACALITGEERIKPPGARWFACTVEAMPVNEGADFIAIDEIHFFASDAVAPIAALRARGVAVAVAGCDIDHFGDLFSPFDALLPIATEVVRIHGTCHRCSAPSTHSERLVATTERIIVGGATEFIATCATCFRPSERAIPRSP